MKTSQKLLAVLAVVVALCALAVMSVIAAPAAPGLQIDKTVTPGIMKAVPNGVLTYTIVLSTTETDAMIGVVLTDTLPPLLRFGEWITQSGAVAIGNQITWSGSVMGQVEFVFTALLPADQDTLQLLPPSITNTVEVTFPGGSGSASATTRFYRYIFLPLVMRNFTP
ncbi:MAG: hypothetical protein WHX52_00680 [Anaerolineae bacterium]